MIAAAASSSLDLFLYLQDLAPSSPSNLPQSDAVPCCHGGSPPPCSGQSRPEALLPTNPALCQALNLHPHLPARRYGLWRRRPPSTLWRPVWPPFSDLGKGLLHRVRTAVVGALGRTVKTRLAFSPFNGALVFVGAMLPRTQSISGVQSLDVAPPAEGATKRIRSDLFEGLDLVAAAQKP